MNAIAVENHQRTFADLGKLLGIEDLAFNAAGICVMGFDETIFRFEYQAERGEILASSIVGRLPEDAPAQVPWDVLMMNAASLANGAGSVGIDPHTSNLVWFDRTLAKWLTVDGLQAWIKTGLARHEFWQSMLPQMVMVRSDEQSLQIHMTEELIFRA